MPFNLFSKEQREKQKQLKEKEKHRKALDQVRQLGNPPKELPLIHFITGASILHPLKGQKGWTPNEETFWLYLYALGFQSLGYLDLAQNVHLRYKYERGNFHNEVLTWIYAAERAAILADRARFALKKLPSHLTIHAEKISRCLENIIALAGQARQVSLEDARALPTYSETEQHEITQNLPASIQGWNSNGHIRLIGETHIPGYLDDEEVGHWLKEDVNSLERPDDLVDYLSFRNLRFSSPGDLIQVTCQGAEGKKIFLSHHGDLSINPGANAPSECELKLSTNAVPGFSLFLGQWDVADMDKWESLAILKLPDIGASNEIAQLKLVFEIAQNGLLSVSAFNQGSQTNLGIFRVI